VYSISIERKPAEQKSAESGANGVNEAKERGKEEHKEGSLCR
jgi:hypothetical protein